MSALWTGGLIVVLFIGLAKGLSRTERAYQFPFLACAIVALFIMPQLPGIFADVKVPADALSKTLFMTLLCLVGALVGWGASRCRPAVLRARFDECRLGNIAIVFALCGALFYYRLSQVPADQVVGVQMSGVPVIYLFFARFLTYALAIAALLYARRPSWPMLAVILFCLIFYLDRILLTGKRAETMELAFIFLLAYWFHGRHTIPKVALVLAALAGPVVMTSMSAYRSITQANSGVVLSEVEAIDPLANLSELLEDGGEEMRNAIVLIDAADKDARFDYGKVHWNSIVSNFVPRQLFGPEMKEAMRLETPPWPAGFSPVLGTTLTGMSDAFRSFWYLGALKFVLLGFVLRRLWESAMEGQFLGQITYTLSIVPGMHAFSHTTDWVVPVWIHMLMFLAPALLLARVAGPSSRPRDAKTAPGRAGAGRSCSHAS